MRIHQIFVPNIYFYQISQIFLDLFAENMNGWSDNSEIWYVEQWGCAEKKLENNNFIRAAILGANISQIFSPPFSSEKILWKYLELRLGVFNAPFNSSPNIPLLLALFPFVTCKKIKWKWNGTQIFTQIFCLKKWCCGKMGAVVKVWLKSLIDSFTWG